MGKASGCFGENIFFVLSKKLGVQATSHKVFRTSVLAMKQLTSQQADDLVSSQQRERSAIDSFRGTKLIIALFELFWGIMRWAGTQRNTNRKVSTSSPEESSLLWPTNRRWQRRKAALSQHEFPRAVRELEQRRPDVSCRGRGKRFAWTKYQMLYNKQKGVYAWCSELMPILKGHGIDHEDLNRTPGFNSDENLQLTNRRCNRVKSSRSIHGQAKKGAQSVVDLVSVAK